MMGRMWQLARDWMLVVAMMAGVAGYLLYAGLPLSHEVKEAAATAAGIVQPALIFAMLFLSFCSISPSRMRPCRWHVWLLLVQGASFTALSLLLILLPHSGLRVVLEGAMICLICPTATASAVVTRKLGGDAAHVTTYIILINLLVSILVPALVPYVHPSASMGVLSASWMILGKVFPLLLMPLVAAMLVRYLLPGLHRRIVGLGDLSFYLWAVALALAIAVTTRSVIHSSVALSTQLWLVGVSAICCAAQFAVGKWIGRRCGDEITAGQALGQKNTVLAIWMGYSFFTPVTAVAGGFYSVWHNVVNSWQLYRHRHGGECEADVRESERAGESREPQGGE